MPLTRTFHDHLLSIMQTDSKNPEVQNRYTAAMRSGKIGPAVSFSGNEANPLFRNTGKGFVEIGTTLGLSRVEDGRGFVLLDLDDDGAQDVVLHNHYRNPIVALVNRASGDHRWVRFRLRGTASNRFGIGARVAVNGKIQELTCGSGYQSGNAPELHFGLGRRDTADVRVRWPSGRVDEFPGLAAGRTHTLTEGSPSLASGVLRPIEIAPDAPEARPALPVLKSPTEGLRTLEGRPVAVEGPAIVAYVSIDCHACGDELDRIGEIEAEARRVGVRVAWVALDPDLGRVAEDFRRRGAPGLALVPPSIPPGMPTPAVYLVAGGRVEGFAGRLAVRAALAEAARIPR